MNRDKAPGQESNDSSQFQYRQLNSDINEVRLVTNLSASSYPGAAIECRLSHVPLHSAPAYEALSYTWADEKGDSSLSSAIRLDVVPFLVTRNLEVALREMRLASSERVFWIDAICIDQKNDPERNHQVGIMRTIYERAAEVAIWLGRESYGSDLAFDFLNGVLRRSDAKVWLHRLLMNEKLMAALAILFLLPYWKRVWIVQEVLSARKKSVYCDEMGCYSRGQELYLEAL